MFKKLVFATFFITLMCVTTTIFAYDVPEMIRVGLSFDNEAVNSFEVTVEGGAVVGHVLDYDFVPHFKINSSKMLVEKGGGAYLRTKNTYDKVEDALDDAQKFSTRDANAYVGYIDKQYYVLFGIYDSQDDAKNAIEELGYTNLDSEKGFVFFQRFLKETGILAELEALGIEEGATVRMYGLVFQYYK